MSGGVVLVVTPTGSVTGLGIATSPGRCLHLPMTHRHIVRKSAYPTACAWTSGTEGGMLTPFFLAVALINLTDSALNLWDRWKS